MLAGLLDVHPIVSDVLLVLKCQRAALREVMSQLDASTTGAQARQIVAAAVAEIDHDVALLAHPADAGTVRAIAGELGITDAAEPVTEASRHA